jgi:hypothetical protein
MADDVNRPDPEQENEIPETIKPPGKPKGLSGQFELITELRVSAGRLRYRPLKLVFKDGLLVSRSRGSESSLKLG